MIDPWMILMDSLSRLYYRELKQETIFRSRVHYGSVGDPPPGEDAAHGAVHLRGPQGRIHHRGPGNNTISGYTDNTISGTSGQGLLHAVGSPAHGAGSDLVSASQKKFI